MDFRIEVVTVPVSDVDRSLQFYAEKVGFAVDIDFRISDEVRLVQLTPPGSSCPSTWVGEPSLRSQATSTAFSWSSRTCAPPATIWWSGAWTSARYRSSTTALTGRPAKTKTSTWSGASSSGTLTATAGASNRYQPAIRAISGALSYHVYC